MVFNPLNLMYKFILENLQFQANKIITCHLAAMVLVKKKGS